MNGIATRLKCALGDTGVSQKKLSQMTGITEVTISRYINGSRVPKATTLARIADALGVGMGYFFDSVDKDTNVPSTDCISRQEAIDAVERAKTAMTTADREIYCAKINAQMNIQLLPSAQSEQPSEIQDILNYLDTVLHPIISPEHWSVYSELHDMISMLPTAQSERKKGDWVYGEDEHGIDGYYCDKCYFFVPWDYQHKLINYIEDYKYCPNCGADMRGEQDE